MVAVVADPDENARANLACSRIATACSKLSLKACQKEKAAGSRSSLPIRVRAPRVLVRANGFADTSLCEGCRKGDLHEHHESSDFTAGSKRAYGFNDGASC